MSNKDTLKGYLRESFDFSQKSSVEFKKDIASSEIKTLGINEIDNIFFREYNERLMVATTELDLKTTDFRSLESTMSPKLQKRTLFLTALVLGEVDLFKYTDENNKKHFFIRQANIVKELSFIRFSSNGKAAELHGYKNQLEVLTKDCPTFAKKKFSFNEVSLKRTIKSYNECVNSLDFVKQKPKGKWVFAPHIGYSLNNLKYDGTDPYAFVGQGAGDIDFPSNSSIFFGSKVEFHSVKKSSRFLPYLDIAFLRTDLFSSAGFRANSRYEFQFSWINFSPGVIYYFNNYGNRFRPFVAGGVSYVYQIEGKNSLTTEDFFGKTINYDPMLNLSKSGYNLNFAIGYNISRVDIEIRYDITTFPASSGQRSLLRVTSASICVGYKLGKK